MPTERRLLCHFLIGVPGSGKSTLAARLAALTGGRVVSTDALRAELYGDASVQGPWSPIERLAIARIRESIASQIPAIYDATNARRRQRRQMLAKLQHPRAAWLGWFLQAPLAQCQAWNQARDRQVPDWVIERMAQALRDGPPAVREGLVGLCRVYPGAGDRPSGTLREGDLAQVCARLAGTLGRRGVGGEGCQSEFLPKEWLLR